MVVAAGVELSKPNRRGLNSKVPFTFSGRIRRYETPRAVTCSSVTGQGIKELWDCIHEHSGLLKSTKSKGGCTDHRAATDPQLPEPRGHPGTTHAG